MFNKEINDHVLKRVVTQLRLKDESEIHDKLRVDVELPALFPVNPWREGWYSVIWLEAGTPFKYDITETNSKSV